MAAGAGRLPGGHRYRVRDVRVLRPGLQALIRSTESDGIWTIQASAFPENEASLKPHLANGFSIVGTRRRIARMTHGPLNGQWRDTLLIERRSPGV